MNDKYNGYYEYKGDILKWSPNKGYFLKMTGWDDHNPDRRLLECEIKLAHLIKVRKAWALEQINKIWNACDREWEHDGIKYDNSIDKWDKIPYHLFPHVWYEQYTNVFSEEEGRYVRVLRNEPIEHTHYNSYKVVWHQGHVYWALNYYYPQIQLVPFESIDKEPNVLSDSMKWTNVHNCRGIVNMKTKAIV